MIIVHAYTMSIVHALCPTELMFDEIEIGGSEGRSPKVIRRGVGRPRGPTVVEEVMGGWDSAWIWGVDTSSGGG